VLPKHHAEEQGAVTQQTDRAPKLGEQQIYLQEDGEVFGVPQLVSFVLAIQGSISSSKAQLPGHHRANFTNSGYDCPNQQQHRIKNNLNNGDGEGIPVKPCADQEPQQWREASNDSHSADCEVRPKPVSIYGEEKG